MLSVKHLCFWLAVLAVTLTAAYGKVAVKAPRRTPRVCVKDAVDVEWQVSTSARRTELVRLEVWDDVQHRVVDRFDLYEFGEVQAVSPSLTTAAVIPKALERLHSVISCLRDGPSRTPDVLAAEWSKTADADSSVLLRFSEATNRPVLEHAAALNNAIVINHGHVRLHTGKGSWSEDGEELRLEHIDGASWDLIVKSISDGTFHAAVKRKPLPGAAYATGPAGDDRSNDKSPEERLEGAITLRISGPGRYTLSLYVGEVLDSSNVDVLEVQECPDELEVTPGVSTDPSSSVRGAALPLPFFAVEGVLAMPGDKWLKVPHSSFPERTGNMIGEHESGSWAIAFWIYLLDDASDSYRGLFYKGDGGDMGRTPSAWLCPRSNRVTLRVSTSTDSDIGADSVAALETRTWNHLAFSFELNTQGQMSAAIFINGAVDVRVSFLGMDVIGNDGPLHIGRDPSNLGPSVAGENVQDGSQGHLRRAQGNPFVDAAFHAATQASKLCRPLVERLEMYKVAAVAGHAESRVRYAALLLVGREHYHEDAGSCAHEGGTSRAGAAARWTADAAKTALEHLELAADQGSAEGCYMLAMLMLSGLDGAAAIDGVCEGCARHRALGIGPVHQLTTDGIAAAVVDFIHHTPSADRDGGMPTSRSMSATTRAIALLHMAAVGGHPEAQFALGIRYRNGNGVLSDTEVAAWYMGCAAEMAHRKYHSIGKQPIVEKQRLTEANEASVATGQQGEDDSLIQFQIHRAAQGHVPSQVALGDLYYWGARGVPRNHAVALEYFNAAAGAGHDTARCAAAGMYLRGEGTEVNHRRAVELYELAAENDHVRALNGLGFEYFNGHAVSRNLTKAYGLFRRAADMRQDGDSLFNAAHCLATGMGTEQDLVQAATLYRIGASSGHVDSAYELGIMSVQGKGVQRDPAEAVTNFQVVAEVGPWARLLRRAFDCYLAEDLLCALALYAQAAELGYEVAATNAAFLLDRRKIDITSDALEVSLKAQDRAVLGTGCGRLARHLWMDLMSVRLHIMAAVHDYPPAFLAIGDAFFYGRAGFPRDAEAASWWYSRASASGLIRGTYNLGYMHEHGLGVRRDYDLALAYYDRARLQGPIDSDVTDQYLQGMPVEALVFFAKIRLHLNRASRGRLASLWEGQEHQEREEMDWLPDWMLLAAIFGTLQSCSDWASSLWHSPRVLNHLDDSTPHESTQAGQAWPLKARLGDCACMLVSLGALWIFWTLRRRRRKGERNA